MVELPVQDPVALQVVPGLTVLRVVVISGTSSVVVVELLISLFAWIEISAQARNVSTGPQAPLQVPQSLPAYLLINSQVLVLASKYRNIQRNIVSKCSSLNPGSFSLFCLCVLTIPVSPLEYTLFTLPVRKFDQRLHDRIATHGIGHPQPCEDSHQLCC